MRNVGLIVRREVTSYVRTPSGWIIAAMFLLVEALILNAWAIGPEPQLSTEVIQKFFFASGLAVMAMAAVFSMRLLAEERATGTHVLLFTSPIREGEVVMGKFLASLAFIMVVVLLSAYLPALVLVRGKVSYGHIGAGYLGLFLVGATMLAVGMFASSITKHPLLAVLVTLGFGVLLELTWWVALIAEPPLRDVLGWFAPFYKHYQPFRRGIVQLSDLAFFGTLIYFALLASTRMLKSQRWQ